MSTLLTFKGFCRTLEIYFRYNRLLLIPVSTKQLSFFLPAAIAELERAFYYVPQPLTKAPGNDATSLTTYTTHTRVSDTSI